MKHGEIFSQTIIRILSVEKRQLLLIQMQNTKLADEQTCKYHLVSLSHTLSEAGAKDGNKPMRRDDS